MLGLGPLITAYGRRNLVNHGLRGCPRGALPEVRPSVLLRLRNPGDSAGDDRHKVTDEFKREAVALLGSSGRPLSRIASELGISPSMLRNWRNGSGGREAGSARHPIPAAAPHSAPDPAAEISRLRRENDRLRTERDILKKAVAIFSEPPR